MLLTVSGYLVYFLFQLKKLNHWLALTSRGEDIDPPEARGFWGAVFDGIFRLQRAEKAAISELQFTLQRAQRSADALDMGIVLLDQEDTLEWWNRAAEKLLGFRKAGDEGQNITNLLRNPKFSEYYTAENYNEPITLASPVNSNIMLELQIIMFGEQEKLIVARDVTREYRLEPDAKRFRRQRLPRTAYANHRNQWLPRDPDRQR